MSIPAFPTNLNDAIAVFETTTKKELISSSFAGYKQVRAKTTRAIKEFDISLRALSNSELNLFDTFYIANMGVEFTLKDPKVDNTTHTVRFVDDNITYNQIDFGVNALNEVSFKVETI